MEFWAQRLKKVASSGIFWLAGNPKGCVLKIIQFGREICQDLDQAVRREWLETNGSGAYASSTVAGVNTRRYHGLLVVPAGTSPEQYVTLNHVSETLFVGDIPFPLSTHFHADTVYPKGYEHLQEFSLYPYPTWIFKCEDLVVTKSLFLVYGEPKVLVRYRIMAGDENWVRLELRPFVSGRRSDGLIRVSQAWRCQTEVSSGLIRCSFASAVPELFFSHNASISDRQELWLKGVRYPEESKRGLDFEEDLYSPFRLEYNFLRSGEVFLCASTQNLLGEDPVQLALEEESRRQNLVKSTYSQDSCFHLLSFSGDSFFINRPCVKKSSKAEEILVNGFPWYEERSRDALLAFHGLVLSTGKFERARRLLIRWSELFENGFVPDRLCNLKEGEKRFSADTPLIFIHDCFEYFEYTQDRETIERILFPVMRSIIEWYVKGSGIGVQLSPDGLVLCEAKLTLMNEHRGGVSAGKKIMPVEIEGLWHNALCEMEALAQVTGHPTLAKTYRQLASRAQQRFNELFWIHHPKLKAAYLCDQIAEGNKDITLRPNQLFAFSLSFPIAQKDPAKIRGVIDVIRKHLLTPYGIRTLAPGESDYCGRYEGTEMGRERIYCCGTVWPWLLVPYVRTFLSAQSSSSKAKKELIEFLRPFSQHLTEKGLGFISEIFDGDFPHEPRGMVASSLNIGACLHLYELLFGKSPVLRKSSSRKLV